MASRLPRRLGNYTLPRPWPRSQPSDFGAGRTYTTSRSMDCPTSTTSSPLDGELSQLLFPMHLGELRPAGKDIPCLGHVLQRDEAAPKSYVLEVVDLLETNRRGSWGHGHHDIDEEGGRHLTHRRRKPWPLPPGRRETTPSCAHPPGLELHLQGAQPDIAVSYLRRLRQLGARHPLPQGHGKTAG